MNALSNQIAIFVDSIDGTTRLPWEWLSKEKSVGVGGLLTGNDAHRPTAPAFFLIPLLLVGLASITSLFKFLHY